MRYTIRHAAILVAGLAVFTATLSPAFSTATTLTATADAFVQSASPDVNRGAATSLRVNDDVKRAYYRFDLSGLPAGEQVTGATLKVYATTGPNCSTGAEVLKAAGEGWDESTITWNNQPGTTGSALATKTSWPANAYVNFDVTSAVSGSGTISFVLRHAPGCTPTADAFFHSREAANKPKLVVNTGAGGPSCGVSNNHNICVTLPSPTLSGTQTITVTNSPNSGNLFIYWVPDGGSERHLRQTFTKDPVTNDYSFMWPTHKYLDGSGVLRFRAVSKTAAPVDVPVSISNGNTTDYQHNPSDWQNYLPGAWNQPSDPVVPAVGDGASDEPKSNQLANAIAAVNPPLFLFLGDIYEFGTHTENLNNFGVSNIDSPPGTLWGKLANVTQPTTGNHEHQFVDDWRDYFHGRPTFTSFTFGGVLFFDLYSSGTQNFSAAQYDLVRNTLASGPPACIVGFWHHPVLNGSSVNQPKLPMWQLLANNGGDLVLNGHAHFMAEYQPLDANLQPGAGAHMVQLLSGAGGHNLAAGKSDPRQVFLKGKTAGAVYLTLNGAANGGTATSISWNWKDVNGNVLHSGSVPC